MIKPGILFILLAMSTMLTGCAKFDKSMESNAVDIPDDDTPPTNRDLTPAPGPVYDANGEPIR